MSGIGSLCFSQKCRKLLAHVKNKSVTVFFACNAFFFCSGEKTSAVRRAVGGEEVVNKLLRRFLVLARFAEDHQRGGQCAAGGAVHHARAEEHAESVGCFLFHADFGGEGNEELLRTVVVTAARLLSQKFCLFQMVHGFASLYGEESHFILPVFRVGAKALF